MAKKSTFNPVKEDQGGKRAQKIIWTTEILDTALAALTAGKKLKINPFYENNSKLLKQDLVFQRTDEEIVEWKKCRNDIVYFAEKYCKLMTPEGIQHVTLRPYQVNYLRHIESHRLSIFLSCRQSGKTTTSAVGLLHYLCFNFDKSAMVCGNKRKTAVEILDKLKKIFVELPFFLRPGVVKWNDGEISFDNGCRCKAEATTKNSAIGETIHLLLLDEFAHVAPNIIDSFYNNIFPTIAAAKARLLITSTQNGYNLFYRLYQSAVAGENEYAPFKVDWYEVPEWSEEEKCWKKRDDEWHAKQIANLGSEEAFNAQFGTSFDVSANTLIAQKKLRKYQEDLVEFVEKDMPGVMHSEYWKWHPDIDPMNLKNQFLVITCDLAEGLDQDYTVFSVYRMTEDGLECIGYFKSNKLHRDVCATSLCMFQCIWTHPERTLVSVERNTYGEIFIDDLFKQNESNPLCANWDPGTLVKYYNESGTKWNYGVKITPGNKSTHCVLFKEAFERNRTICQDTAFASELLNFCDDGTGHYKASFGHDDLIMTAVQLEFVKETLQYKLLRDDFNTGLTPMTDTLWNPYDINSIPPEVSYDISEGSSLNKSRLK